MCKRPVVKGNEKMTYKNFFTSTNSGPFGKIWYDNEWGYSNRCVDLAVFIGKQLKASGKANPQKFAATA
jgi:glyceraldehyde 3-phosphate dehydrogenase